MAFGVGGVGGGGGGGGGGVLETTWEGYCCRQTVCNAIERDSSLSATRKI